MCPFTNSNFAIPIDFHGFKPVDTPVAIRRVPRPFGLDRMSAWEVPIQPVQQDGKRMEIIRARERNRAPSCTAVDSPPAVWPDPQYELETEPKAKTQPDTELERSRNQSLAGEPGAFAGGTTCTSCKTMKSPS